MGHMKVDIKGALMNNSFGGYYDENGKPVPPRKVKMEFLARLSKGELYFPMGNCPTFDPKVGCRCEEKKKA